MTGVLSLVVEEAGDPEESGGKAKVWFKTIGVDSL